MNDHVRWFAEGGLAGVLVRRKRWRVLARFRGDDAERMARALAQVIQAGGLVRGSDISGPASSEQPPAS